MGSPVVRISPFCRYTTPGTVSYTHLDVYKRQIIRKLQTMRKEAGFEVMDHIIVYARGNDRIAEILSSHEAAIQSDVLAVAVRLDEMGGYSKEWDINGETVTLGVEKTAE